MERMDDIRDEHGNPIQLTDEHGNPVVLTDEYGNPMHLTGVATKIATTLGSLIRGGGVEDGGNGPASDAKAGSAGPGAGGGHGDGKKDSLHEEHDDAHDGGYSGHVRSTTSGSSSSEEEDEQSRKKIGLTQKIKEKLTGGKHKEEQPHSPATAMDRPTELDKKGAVEKIKEKMLGSGSGHHHHTH